MIAHVLVTYKISFFFNFMYHIAQENYGNEKEKISNKGFITERCLKYSPKVPWTS